MEQVMKTKLYGSQMKGKCMRHSESVKDDF